MRGEVEKHVHANRRQHALGLLRYMKNNRDFSPSTLAQSSSCQACMRSRDESCRSLTLSQL